MLQNKKRLTSSNITELETNMTLHVSHKMLEILANMPQNRNHHITANNPDWEPASWAPLIMSTRNIFTFDPKVI